MNDPIDLNYLSRLCAVGQMDAEAFTEAVTELERLRGRVTELLVSNNQFEARAREAERIHRMLTFARPISQYHEDMGTVLWWKFPVVEAPYVGTPNDLGFEVLVETTIRTMVDVPEPIAPDDGKLRVHVGGWPGYHTHWTPIPAVTGPRR